MVERIKNWWKLHYKSILIFLGILLIISPIILSRSLGNLDEIWNYNFARNIADGLIPYKDFNMVPTPLLSFIAALILNLFGNELIIMRILAILLISSIFFMIYKILKKLNINLFYIFTFLFLLLFLLKDHICIDYNFAVLFLTLILIYLELNHRIKNNAYFNNYLLFSFISGFISGCCILCKQSTGLIVAGASIIYPILFIKNKVDLKNYFKMSILKIIGILIPIILLVIYLIFNNALYDFIDYTILGIKTFQNSIPYTYLINSQNISIKLISIIAPFFILISGIYILIKRKKELYGLYAYSLASVVVAYPIADHIHFLIGITPFLILFSYLLFKGIIKIKNYILNNKIGDKNKDNNNKFNKLINNKLKFKKIKLYFKYLIKSFLILYFIYYIIISCMSIYKYIIDPNKDHNFMHYKYIPISQGLQNKITLIDEYIIFENNPVYILDAEAALHMIPINKYNKDYDMFSKGNLGGKGELGQIEKIQELNKGTKILLINPNYKANWQSPLQVHNFIRSNLNKIGEISIFDIYEIN